MKLEKHSLRRGRHKIRLVITFDRKRFVRAASTVALVYAGVYCVAGGIFASLFLFWDRTLLGALFLTGCAAFFAAAELNQPDKSTENEQEATSGGRR